MSYILITPCRNEENNLPNLERSITAQTIKPCLWVIVDDRSSDNTPSIIKNLQKQHEWIKGLYLTEAGEYMGSHYSRVCIQGFDFAMKQCSENKLSYEYIALVDADNILEESYFETLMHEFERKKDLGIASGINAFISREKLNDFTSVLDVFNIFDTLKIQQSREDVPMGSARMWRKECFMETGGYMQVYTPDSVSNAKAKMRGWKIKRVKDARVVERGEFIAQGLWKRSKEMGRSYYYLWHPLLYVVMKSIKYSFNGPYYTGIGYLFGYVRSAIRHETRVEDEDVKRYYTHVRPKELYTHYIAKFKRMVGYGSRI
ncbi:glycosyl transferase [Candidatus Methanoperedens nitroreducens]|uniref:Glycosyl transferase n=1 Tax=Candidatus Methanoperedens nitratireducens TaxID=1392998 RepID=A0A062V4M0_9EURY|nr:glycosyltransferase family A protein [Candidatus Methanoperedens nitroreducens]KCZ72287.1 glycosyl transferase [Candidatus Methanoperedens nitroreducens]MDJ1420752.1 glycosyltransferase family A protein [Candidatus Methanoperedens sp.]